MCNLNWMRYGQNYHIASLGISGRLAGGKVGKIVISKWINFAFCVIESDFKWQKCGLVNNIIVSHFNSETLAGGLLFWSLADGWLCYIALTEVDRLCFLHHKKHLWMAETLRHGKNCYIRMVRMVTIIHLPEAPNPKVGPPTLHQARTYLYLHFSVRDCILGEYHVWILSD